MRTGLVSSVILLVIYGDMIRGDTAPKKLGLRQPRKPAGSEVRKGDAKIQVLSYCATCFPPLLAPQA